MTAPLLLGLLCAALLVQLAAGIGVAMWRRRRRGGATSVDPADPADPAEALSEGAWRGLRKLRVARRELEDAAHTQCSFYLEPVDGAPLPAYLPGQYLTLVLNVAGTGPGAPGEPRTLTRCYSLSDRPDEAAYRITVKRVPAPSGRAELPPGACSTHLHDAIHEGDIVEARAPAGRFVLDPDASVPTVLIAGGIGVTPMMSMLRGCLAEEPQRVVHLYYGARHGGEQAFKQALEGLAAAHPSFHLHVVYSNPAEADVPSRDFHHTGHIDVDLLRRTLPAGRHRFYVCGPPPMMNALLPALGLWGVLPEDIRTEAFGPASVLPSKGESMPSVSGAAAPMDIVFRGSDRTLVWDGQDRNLLDFAERHGLALESGCRSGSCGSCAVKLVSGTVRYAREPDAEVTPGHCLPCVCVPSSPLVLEVRGS